MHDETLVQRTARLSLAIQFVAGALSLAAFASPVKYDDPVVMDVVIILLIESIAQVIEFAYYLVAVLRYQGRIATWTRYIDWFLSTPVMLASTAMFFVHRDGGRIRRAVQWPSLYISLAFNALMLAIGLAVELGVLPRVGGVAAGSFALVASFLSLSTLLDTSDPFSIVVFCFNLVTWAFYGVAALLGVVGRNVAYNLLDVVSKNFYSLVLSVYVFTL